MDDSLRDGDSESEVDLTDLDVGPSTSRSNHLPSTSRQMRNEAEKKRRDTLNGYINELGRLVPMVDGTPRRVDKISILRLAATYLMQNQILYTSSSRQSQFFPEYLENYNLSQRLIEEMDAFMIVVTAAGKIVFVSHTVEKLLGHPQIDMFGQSLYNFTLKADHPLLAFNLSHDADPDCQPPPADSPDGGGGSAVSDDTNSSSSSDISTPSPAPLVLAIPAEPVPIELQKRSFFLQLSQRSVSRTEQPEYKRVHFLGNLRIPRFIPGTLKPKSKRQRAEWPVGEGVGAGMETVLIAMVKLEHRIQELSLLESTKEEYVTRHLIDGRIVYSDHRISLVAGYFSEDVSGMSAFKFMHPEDVMFTIVALRQMYDRGEGFGSSCYRLQCANGNFIYLRTHGYLEKNEDTNQVESFICVNTLVGHDIGERLIQEMKARYSASIEGSSQSTPTITEVTEDDPSKKLDNVIAKLIPSTVDPPKHSVPFPDTQYMKAAITSKSLPPPSHHIIKQSLGSPTQEVVDRPSVITLRRRRTDSSNESASKRRRSDEVLSIQVPCDDMSRVLQEYSPNYVSPNKHGTDQRLRGFNSGSLTSPYKQELLSPEYNNTIQSPNQYPRNHNQSYSEVNSVGYLNDLLSSPSQSYSDTNPPSYRSDSLISPTRTNYVYTPLLDSPNILHNQQSYPETLVNTTSDYDEPERPMFSMEDACLNPNNQTYWPPPVDVGEGEEGTVDRSEFQSVDMLSQSSEDPEPALIHLENTLHRQNVLITTIKHDIQQVPQPKTLPPPLCQNLNMIMEEHKQHQIQLKTLRQEHKSLSEQD